jgi:hypothetical protein
MQGKEKKEETFGGNNKRRLEKWVYGADQNTWSAWLKTWLRVGLRISGNERENGTGGKAAVKNGKRRVSLARATLERRVDGRPEDAFK